MTLNFGQHHPRADVRAPPCLKKVNHPPPVFCTVCVWVCVAQKEGVIKPVGQAGERQDGLLINPV